MKLLHTIKTYDPGLQHSLLQGQSGKFYVLSTRVTSITVERSTRLFEAYENGEIADYLHVYDFGEEHNHTRALDALTKGAITEQDFRVLPGEE